MTCREQHLEPSRSCEPTSVLVERICWNYVKFIRYRLIKKDEDRVRFTVWPTWLFVPNMCFHVLSHVSMGLLVFVYNVGNFETGHSIYDGALPK